MKWLTFLIAASLLGADCCPEGALSAPNCACKQYECVEGKLFSATPCIQNPCSPCEIFFITDVSILAWQAIEAGLDFALENKPLPLAGNLNVNGHLVGPDFGWEPAFKMNLGMLFAERAWDAGFRWTYFHGRSSKTVERAPLPNSSGIIPLWAFPNADVATQFLYGHASGQWGLNFNGFDIEMGYNPFLTPLLSFRFLAGLKVAQMNQEFHVRYSDGFNDGAIQLVSANADLTNKAIGAGPRLGFESKWLLGKGFFLQGSIAGSLPLWHYRVTRADADQNIRNGVLQTIQSSFRDRFWTFRSVLETALGFGWDTCFGCLCQYPFGLYASYEFQYYPEQNMMAMLVNPGLLSYAFMSRGDLIFHGVTTTFHFGF